MDAMTLEEFEHKIHEIIPGAEILRDNYGQLVIYTGLTVDPIKNDYVVDMEPDIFEDG